MIGEIKLFLAQEVIFNTNELFLEVGWFIWVILKLDDEVKGMKVGSPLSSMAVFRALGLYSGLSEKFSRV